MSTRPLFPWGRIQLAFAAVVLSFVSAQAVADMSLREIDASASGIAMQASPAIEHLSAARTELRRLRVLAGPLGEAGDVIPHQQRLRAARRRLDEEVTAYLSLPSAAVGAQVREHIEQGAVGLEDRHVPFARRTD